MLQAAILEDDADTLFCLLTEGHPCLRYEDPAAIGREEELQLLGASIGREEWDVDRMADESLTTRADRVMLVLPSEPLPVIPERLADHRHGVLRPRFDTPYQCGFF